MIGILFLSEESVLPVIVTAHVLSHKTPLKILNRCCLWSLSKNVHIKNDFRSFFYVKRRFNGITSYGQLGNISV